MGIRHGSSAAAAALALGVLLSAAGCASAGAGTTGKAPAPAKPIVVDRFYVGRWYEIARTPMHITRNCVAGTTDYSRLPDGGIFDTDACHMGTPEGRTKTFDGPVTLLNPGENTKMRVSYIVWHIFRIPRVYWILDHDDDYRWFILSDPAFEHVSLFSRDPRPPTADLSRMTTEVRAMGYDTSKLETPAQFPAGGH